MKGKSIIHYFARNFLGHLEECRRMPIMDRYYTHHYKLIFGLIGMALLLAFHLAFLGAIVLVSGVFVWKMIESPHWFWALMIVWWAPMAVTVILHTTGIKDFDDL